MSEKFCPSCAEVKPVEAFHLSRRDGRYHVCRDCRSEMRQDGRKPDTLNTRTTYWRCGTCGMGSMRMFDPTQHSDGLCRRCRALTSDYVKGMMKETAR